MPRRNAITISLDDDTLTMIDEAAGLHGGNRSAAVKAFVRGDVVASDAPVRPNEHWYEVTEATNAALNRYAHEHGITPNEAARLALRFAVRFADRWAL